MAINGLITAGFGCSFVTFLISRFSFQKMSSYATKITTFLQNRTTFSPILSLVRVSPAVVIQQKTSFPLKSFTTVIPKNSQDHEKFNKHLELIGLPLKHTQLRLNTVVATNWDLNVYIFREFSGVKLSQNVQNVLNISKKFRFFYAFMIIFHSILKEL